jgi:predicted negative regulator of RcsB-dependent stress response
MSKYETDEEQIAAIKDWWNKNSTSLLSTILVVAVGWFGWTYYQNDKRVKAESASTIFNVMEASLAQNKFGDIAREGMKLIKEQPDSPYSAGASLLLAKYHLQQNKTEQAMKDLQWVIDHSTDASLVLVAKFRMVNVLVDLKKNEQANEILDAIQAEKLLPAEQANLAYLKGTLALKENKTDVAILLFKQVVENEKSAANLIRLSQLQLDDLSK